MSNSDLNRRPSICKKHRREKIVFYCTKCRKPCCTQCRYNEHQDHEIQQLSTAAIRCKKLMLDMQTELKQYRRETQDIIHDVKLIMADFQRKAEHTKEKIETEFNKIIRFIKEKKVKLIEELLCLEALTKKRFENEIEEMQIKNVRANSLELYSYNLAKYGSDSEAVEFETKIADNWNKLKDETLHRYGMGFQLNIEFSLKQRVPELLEGDIGALKASQYLSPWPKRRKLEEVVQGSLKSNLLRMAVKVKDANLHSYPIKRSEVYSKLVDSRYRFGSSKICPITGYTATVWMKLSSHERTPSIGEMISQQFGSKPNTTDRTLQKVGTAVLEVEVHNGTGMAPRQITMNNIPDIDKVKLALNESGQVYIALYPGSALSAELKKKRSVRRQIREDEGIYVATVNEVWDTVCDGYFTKIDILEEVEDRSKLMFDITKEGNLVVHHPSFLKVFVYSPAGVRRDIDCLDRSMEILNVCEGKDGGILVMSTQKGFIFGNEYTATGEQKPTSFCIRGNLDTGILCPQLQIKNACFDTKGNMLLHYRKDEDDQLVIVCAGTSTEEILCKPDMFHRVDQMSILPQGRICLFDKTECVLMTFQYLE